MYDRMKQKNDTDEQKSRRVKAHDNPKCAATPVPLMIAWWCEVDLHISLCVRAAVLDME
jgi:hypothetical protein